MTEGQKFDEKLTWNWKKRGLNKLDITNYDELSVRRKYEDEKLFKGILKIFRQKIFWNCVFNIQSRGRNLMDK